MGRRGIRIAAVLCCALILCLQPAAHAAQARIPLSAGEIGIREFEVSSSVSCETVFTLEGWEWLKPYLADGYRRPEGLDLVQLLGTSKQNISRYESGAVSPKYRSRFCRRHFRDLA